MKKSGPQGKLDIRKLTSQQGGGGRTLAVVMISGYLKGKDRRACLALQV